MYDLLIKKGKTSIYRSQGESYPLKSFKRSLGYEITELRGEIYYLHWPQNLEMKIYACF